MDPILGQIILWPGAVFVPQGWLPCDGRQLQVSQYAALFSILGKVYGGDGTTTFALPDLRGRVPLGIGQGIGSSNNFAMGQKGGSEQTTLNTAQMPTHTHGITVTGGTFTVKGTPYNNNPGTTNNPTASTCLGTGATGSSDDTNIYNTNVATGNMPNQEGTITGVTGQIGNSGSGQAFSNMQPYVALNYIIAVEGIYPNRP